MEISACTLLCYPYNIYLMYLNYIHMLLIAIARVMRADRRRVSECAHMQTGHWVRHSVSVSVLTCKQDTG